MKIAVCVKQIQDPEIATALFRVDEATNSVVPVAGLAPVMSPYDEQAIEAALRIKDKQPDTKIVLITVGGPTAKEVLKQGLSMGADEAVLLSAPETMAVDGYVTASLLRDAVRKVEDVDLILTGRQSADLDAGVVSCGLAELLDIPAINFGMSVEVVDGKMIAERVLDNGSETVEAPLPALVAVSNEIGPARKPSLREPMRSSRKPMAAWSPGDVSSENIEARQDIVRLYIPKKDKHCEMLAGANAEEVAGNLVRKLRSARLI